jgi:hypothetical protein
MHARRFMDVIYGEGKQAAHRKYLKLNILITITAEHVCQKFVRALEESDWARYDYYSRRIRRLGRSMFDINNRDCDVHKDVLSALGTYRPARILLPNLRTVIFNSESSIALPCAQAIFGPSITSVSFAGLDPPAHLSVLCSSLSRLSPCIQEVRYYYSTAPPPAFFRLILGLQNLRVVHVMHKSYVEFPVTVWKHLVGLPSLREVEGALLAPAHIPVMKINHSPFMGLRRFDFGADWKTCGSMIESMHCRLEVLAIAIWDEPWPMSTLEEFTRSLSQLPCRNSLKTFCLFTPSPTIGDSTASLSQALQPLFLCADLQDVQFVSLPIHFLDDAWLLNAALSWKSLRRLCLGADCEQTVKTGTNFSLAGLVPLVKHCPKLHTLCLSFHARAVHPDSIDGVCSRNIQSLTIGWDSTILSPPEVIRSLLTLFPDLKKVIVEEGVADLKAWEEVKSWLEASAYEK